MKTSSSSRLASIVTAILMQFSIDVQGSSQVGVLGADDLSPFDSVTFQRVAKLLERFQQSKDIQPLLEELDILELRLRETQVTNKSLRGGMSLPSPLIDKPEGFQGGLDSESFVSACCVTNEQAGDMMSVIMLYKLLPPDLAFRRIERSQDHSSTTMLDVALLEAFISSPPGLRTSELLNKSDWYRLYQSRHPVSHFIALEKFDSVLQSPDELLSLYRECMFKGCSYLEVRALESMIRNNDLREAVARLLEEYIASNPPANDGTLPSLRNNFPSLIEGAKRVIATIRNSEQAAASTSSQSDPFAQTSPPPKPVVQPPMPKEPEAKSTVPTPSEESTSTIPWSVIALSILAATGLLGLLVKKCK